MALSKDEQRTLDEIERGLREDIPEFADAARFDRLRRHRVILGGGAFLLGVVALVVGEVVSQVQLTVGVMVSLAGFGAMFAAIAWTVQHRYHAFRLDRSAKPGR
jgi:hypothetical protein